MATVAELKDLLDNLPDTAEILIKGSYHSYLKTDLSVGMALLDNKTGHWFIDDGVSRDPWDKVYSRKTVLLLVERKQ